MSKLRDIYSDRYNETLAPLAPLLEQHLVDLFNGVSRIDRISARPKSIKKFLEKAGKIDGEKLKYTDPLHQIQDQLGARIITFYKSDVERVATHALRYLQPIESKDLVPDSHWEFGYFGKHFVFVLPSDVWLEGSDPNGAPQFFELQIKTLFQHAWSEANHDLGYKPESGSFPPDGNRRLAYTSAQAWGADRVFDELFHEVSTQK